MIVWILTVLLLKDYANILKTEWRSKVYQEGYYFNFYLLFKFEWAIGGSATDGGISIEINSVCCDFITKFNIFNFYVFLFNNKKLKYLVLLEY
jgi:hypothetical protein